MTQLDSEIPSWKDNLVRAERSLYDQVLFDSEIERAFVQGLEKDERVKLYVKLPHWFTVDTPIGKYNPDWAIVWEPRDEHGQPTGEELLYLVRETKENAELDELRPDEARKIRCGKRHFEDALRVNYAVVSSVDQLP